MQFLKRCGRTGFSGCPESFSQKILKIKIRPDWGLRFGRPKPEDRKFRPPLLQQNSSFGKLNASQPDGRQKS
jgi:hypothetical protein